jgi:hypothetical protein
MPLTPTKYDKIYVKSRNPYKIPEPVKYNEEKEIQLRLYFRCESSHYTKHMKVNLWYSKDMEEWRWTLSSDVNPKIQESGNRDELRGAMNDVANTVEYLLDSDMI